MQYQEIYNQFSLFLRLNIPFIGLTSIWGGQYFWLAAEWRLKNVYVGQQWWRLWLNSIASGLNSFIFPGRYGRVYSCTQVKKLGQKLMFSEFLFAFKYFSINIIFLILKKGKLVKIKPQNYSKTHKKYLMVERHKLAFTFGCLGGKKTG